MGEVESARPRQWQEIGAQTTTGVPGPKSLSPKWGLQRPCCRGVGHAPRVAEEHKSPARSSVCTLRFQKHSRWQTPLFYNNSKKDCLVQALKTKWPFVLWRLIQHPKAADTKIQSPHLCNDFKQLDFYLRSKWCICPLCSHSNVLYLSPPFFILSLLTPPSEPVGPHWSQTKWQRAVGMVSPSSPPFPSHPSLFL